MYGKKPGEGYWSIGMQDFCDMNPSHFICTAEGGIYGPGPQDYSSIQPCAKAQTSPTCYCPAGTKYFDAGPGVFVCDHCDAQAYYKGQCLDLNDNGIPDAWEEMFDPVPKGPQPVPQDEAYISRDMCQLDFGILRSVIPVRLNTCSLCIYAEWGAGGARNKLSPNCDASAPEPHCLVKHYPDESFTEQRKNRFRCEVVWPPGSEVNK